MEEKYKGMTIIEIVEELEKKSIKDLTVSDVLLYEALTGSEIKSHS